jgi:hypothetical protein
VMPEGRRRAADLAVFYFLKTLAASQRLARAR